MSRKQRVKSGVAGTFAGIETDNVPAQLNRPSGSKRIESLPFVLQTHVYVWQHRPVDWQAKCEKWLLIVRGARHLGRLHQSWERGGMVYECTNRRYSSCETQRRPYFRLACLTPAAAINQDLFPIESKPSCPGSCQVQWGVRILLRTNNLTS
jgi:hypothetical protein